MRKPRWEPFAIALCASVAVVAACVGDDPTSPPATTDGGVIDAGNGSSVDSGGQKPPDNDAGVDAGGDAGPKRYCETVSKPLPPTDFFCADFDGVDPAEGWTQSFKVDGGTLELTTAVAVSAPQSLLIHPAPGVGSGSGPQLSWNAVGANKFVKADLSARMNPTNPGGVSSYTGEIKLLEIRTSNALVALYYTNGGTLATIPSTNNYAGYFIHASTFGGAAMLIDYPVTTALSPATWTNVTLAWEATGQTVLSYNDVPVFTKGLFDSNDTSVTFNLGAASSGQVNELKQMRFDNVEIKLERAQ